ncbi:MAG: efflux RND transporter permease subunit [Myxococcota bacterium]|nr:efflux RND transporter permease subunit [Myxococcota bacterium]
MRSLVLLLALLGCRGRAEVSPPVIAISIVYAGASAEVIESMAVVPIEQAVGSIPGVTEIDSRIESDHATIFLVLENSADLDTKVHDVRHALSLAQPRLPHDVLPPTITRASRDERPIVWLELRNDAMPIVELSSAARALIEPVLERLPGVAMIEEHGLAKSVVIVRPDLDRLLAAKLALFDVLAAVQATDATQLEMLGDIVIKQVDGAPIRVRDIAMVEQGFEREPSAGKPMLAVRAQHDAKKPAVLAAVRTALADVRAALPPGMTVTEAPPPASALSRPPAPLVVTFVGPSLDELRRLADAFVAEAKLTDVVRDPPVGERELTVLPDRDRAAQLGIPLPDIFATLAAIDSERVGDITLSGTRYPILVKPSAAPLPELLDKLFVRNRDGALVPLSTVVSLEERQSRGIMRRNGERAIALAIYAPSTVLAAAKTTLKVLTLPAGYRVSTTSP